jgi:hypothetical protein
MFYNTSEEAENVQLLFLFLFWQGLPVNPIPMAGWKPWVTRKAPWLFHFQEP